MTDQRFKELIDGPLWFPLLPFTVSRLALALRDVVERCGAAGDKALEEHCRLRQERDDAAKALPEQFTDQEGD